MRHVLVQKGSASLSQSRACKPGPPVQGGGVSLSQRALLCGATENGGIVLAAIYHLFIVNKLLSLSLS